MDIDSIISKVFPAVTENVIEKRLSNDLGIEETIQDNLKYLRGCISHGLEYFLIDDEYDLERCCI